VVHIDLRILDPSDTHNFWYYYVQGVSLAIGPKVFLITFKIIDVI
jgi:hypothetical protein